MKRIIFHWTAGAYKANDVDKKSYHFIIEGDGTVVNGIYRPEDNLSTADGKYAKHTKGLNTGSIGVSLACMSGAREVPFNPGKFPMTKTQWDAGIRLGAQLAKRYRIPVLKETILSHAEVEKTLGVKQNNKWDFTRLAWAPEIIGAEACGNLLRNSIKKELENAD